MTIPGALADHDIGRGGDRSTRFDCWCLPKIYRPCDDCADEPSEFESFAGVAIAHLPRMPEKPAGCWKCEHGLVLLSVPENINDRGEPITLVIVHDVAAERPTR